MKLEEFISNTIYEICMGIEDAQKRLHDEFNNHVISPSRIAGKEVGYDNHQIDFDLSVTSSVENTVDKRAGVIKVIDAGVGKTDVQTHEAVNRIKFSVPFVPQALKK